VPAASARCRFGNLPIDRSRGSLIDCDTFLSLFPPLLVRLAGCPYSVCPVKWWLTDWPRFHGFSWNSDLMVTKLSQSVPARKSSSAAKRRPDYRHCLPHILPWPNKFFRPTVTWRNGSSLQKESYFLTAEHKAAIVNFL
jgi:hypothetical protein